MASNAYAQGKATNIPTPPQLGGPVSPAASPPPASGTPPTPPASNFNEYCKRKGADRGVDKTAENVEKALGFGLNASINVMAQLKEILTSPVLAAAAPGLRQVAGCCLHILETIGQMGDNVAAFNQLASQSYDNCMLLLTCMEIIDDTTEMAQKAKDKLNETALEFYRVMDNILKAMQGLNSRSKFTRFVFAKADRNDLDKHRSAMNHLINKLQITLHLANLAKKGGGSENKTIKQLTAQDVHKAAEGYRAILVKRAEDEYNRQVAEYNHYVTITTNATANFNAGENSNVYKSGNVSTKIISGQNDYSTNTNTVTITNGNFGADAFSKKRDRPRDRRDTRGWSDSDDSDGRDTPRERRERRRRDTDYDRGYSDGRY